MMPRSHHSLWLRPLNEGIQRLQHLHSRLPLRGHDRLNHLLVQLHVLTLHAGTQAGRQAYNMAKGRQAGRQARRQAGTQAYNMAKGRQTQIWPREGRTQA